METISDTFLKIIQDYQISYDEIQNDANYNEEQMKKLKKKLKKNIVDLNEDDLNTAYEKFNKMIEGLNKSFQTAFKAKSLYKASKDGKEALMSQLSKQAEHKKRIQALHSSFMKKYNQELKVAQNYEIGQTENKKKYTEELQSRIKFIQDQFEESGRRKIQSIKQNEIVKQELNRLLTHFKASQTMVDVELKKKGLEVDIDISALKQKVDVIQTLKAHDEGSSQKLDKAKLVQIKIQKRLKVYEQKQEEHKLLMSKAHILIDDYKMSIFKIRQMLQKIAFGSQKLMMKCRKSQDALKSSKDQQSKLKTERDIQNAQLEGLQNLQTTLRQQLKKL